MGSPISESCLKGLWESSWKEVDSTVPFCPLPFPLFSCLEWVWYLEPQWSCYDHTATLKMKVTSYGRAEEQKEPGPWRAWFTRLKDLCYTREEEIRYLGFLLHVTQHGPHRYMAWWPCSFLWAPVTLIVTTVFREIFGYKQSSLPI